MQKLFFLVGIIQIFCLTQSYGQAPSLKAGFNAASITSPDRSNKILPGYYFGVGASKKITQEISLKAELVYSLQGAKAHPGVTAKYGYFNMPLLLSLKLDDKVEFNFGPQVGLIYNARLKGAITTDVTSKLNAIDVALATGLCFHLNDSFAIESRINYGLSNTARDPVPDGSYRNVVFQIGGLFSFKKN